MFDFDHIDAWGPGLSRELSGAIPGDVPQAIASGKPKLIEDARDILLSNIDQSVVLKLVVNWLKLQTICAYHGSRLTVEEIVDVRRDGLRLLKATDRDRRLRTILSAHPQWPTVERSLTQVIDAYGVNWLQNNSGRREGSVHATISRSSLIKSFNGYLKYGSEFDQVVSQRLLGDEGVELLGSYGSPVIFKIAVPGVVAVHAANSYLPELPIGLPNLVRELLDAWAFWLANPTFTTQTIEVDCGLKFSAGLPPAWIIDCEQVVDPGRSVRSIGQDARSLAFSVNRHDPPPARREQWTPRPELENSQGQQHALAGHFGASASPKQRTSS
jgi:hypothetical protein